MRLLPFTLRWLAELGNREPTIAPTDDDAAWDRQDDNAHRNRPHRDMSKVVAVTVHQTGIEYGVSKRQVARADGDEELAYLRRFDTAPYHDLTTRHGHNLFLNDPRRYTPHAGPLNRTSVGCCFEGLFPRFARKRVDGKHTRLTDERIQAYRVGFRRCVYRARQVGALPRYVWAHCQGSKRRVQDPGEEIMDHVVVPLLAELELELVPGWTVGSGRPLPPEWLDGRAA